MTVVEAVRQWIQTCPELADGFINIDWLPADAREFAIDVVPCNEVLKRYITGKTRKQFLFYLSSREFLGNDIRDAQDNHQFYENFSAWVAKQNARRNLPDLGGNRTANSICITTSGYPMQTSDDGRARYQIQLRLEYTEEAY